MAESLQSDDDRDEAGPDPITIWEAQPGPQTALIACPVFEVFFGGARGGEWVCEGEDAIFD